MHAVDITPPLNAPPTIETLGDAVASMLYEWSQLSPELRDRNREAIYMARATASAISEVLCLTQWQTIPIEKLLGLDKVLIDRARAEGATGANLTRYARNCRHILSHAKSRGCRSQALTRLKSWDVVMNALKADERGVQRMIEDLGIRKIPAETTEDDLKAAGQRAMANGLAECTSEKYVGHFRSRMRAAKLEAMFPLLDLKFKRSTFYCDPIEKMAGEAQAELNDIKAFLTPVWVPDRASRDATRMANAKQTVRSFRQLHAWVRTHRGIIPPTLRALVDPEYVLPWIDWLENDRHLLREAVKGAAGLIHSIASKHEIFEGLDLDWILTRIRKVPKERHYKRQMRKQEQAVAYELLDQIPQQLRTKSEAPGLSAVKIARLRHDEEVVKTLLLALRQRNIRECDLSGNLVWDEINPKMAFNLDLSGCVQAAWDDDHHRRFLLLKYSESDTKANRAEIVAIPLAHAESLWEFVQVHRQHLVAADRDHGKLFCNLRGEELSEQAFRKLVRRITKTCLGKGVSPHLWRSIFGARVLHLAALGIGGGLLHAQRALFHKTPEPTQNYLDLNYALPGITAVDFDYDLRLSAMD